MECDICTEHFDGAERLPKVLPCGHTACLQCMRRLPGSKCPTCRRDVNGPPEELPTNFAVLQFLERVRQSSTPRGWCSDCLAAAMPRCWEDHDVLSVRSALRHQLQGALPQAAELLQGLPDQCRDEQALLALTLLTSESWGVTLRSGARELTGTLPNTKEPLTKALWLLLATMAALDEDGGAIAATLDPEAASAGSLRLPPAAQDPTAASVGSPPPATLDPEAASAGSPPPATLDPEAAAVGSPPPATLDPEATSAGSPPPATLDPEAVAVGSPPPATLDPTAAAVGSLRLPPAAQDYSPAEALPARVMDVDALSDSGADDRQQEKAAALRDAAGVTRLVNVVCREDPIWSLELLQRAAATVEELRLTFPDEAHLLAVLAMPRLRRLEVTGNAYACVPELPALRPGAGVLQWLRVDGLPRATTQTLLRALGRSLEVLQMGVGTAGDGEWPFSCDDLQSLLEQCGLRALRRLVLGRIVGCTHVAAPCDRQRADARRVLPGAEVLCNWCDSVAGEVV